MLTLVYLSVLLPMLGAVLVIACPRFLSRGIGLIASILATFMVLLLMQQFHSHGMQAISIPLVAVNNVEIIGITIDTVSVLVAEAVVSIGLLIQIYSNGYISSKNQEHPDHFRRRYFAFLTLFIGAMAGVVFSSTLLGQLLFFEITGLCSWGLIGYYGQKKSFYSAGKALLITHIASIGLYAAASLLFVMTGKFTLSAIAELDSTPKTIVLLLVFFAGWGKSAQWPLYMWLPDAMEAPTPVSAYLHAASMVKVGVYIVARALLASHGASEIVGYAGSIMATITLVFGFLMYLPQTDMKRLLAYSTITQLGYMFLGLSLSVFGSQLAFNGAIAHLFNHAFAKTLFFLVAGALAYSAGTRALPELRGLLRKSPLLGIAFVAAAMAISGVPPFNGFFSKFAIFAGGFGASQHHPMLYVLMAVAMIESIATFAWLLLWTGRVVFGEPSEKVAAAQPLPLTMSSVIAVLIVMSVVSSFIAAAWLG